MNAARDSFGNFAKFVPPLVANGRVYVATWSNQVAVYGLIAPAPVLTTVSPASGPITGGTAVTLTGQNFAIRRQGHLRRCGGDLGRGGECHDRSLPIRRRMHKVA